MTKHGTKPCNSTRNISRNTTLELLDRFDIPLSELSRYTQLPQYLVKSALEVHSVERCPVIVLIKVKTTAEILLRQRGWQGDAQLLWREFYAMLESAGRPPDH